MKNGDKIVNAIIDLSQKMEGLSKEIKGLRKDMNEQLGALNIRVEKLENQQAITNLEIRELRLSNMRIADAILNHDERIDKLEKIALK